MSDIFISYSRDDQTAARRFAEAFEREGLTVWWDQTLKPGEAYDRVTERALREAKAVVVLWSRKSVESHWVRSEATQAQSTGTLIPVMIEPCKRPIMFELMHTAELGHWKGDPNDSAWRAFVGDVRQFIGQSPVQAAAIAPQPWRRKTPAAQIFVLCAVIALLFAAPFWVLHRRAAVPTAPVAPAADPIRLGVLPFSILSADSDQQYLSEGLAEDISIQLNQIRALSALGPASTRRFAGSKDDPRAISTALDVTEVVTGTVRRNEQKWIFTVYLIDGGDGTPRWQEHYEGEDVFALQERIVKDVAQAVGVVLGVTDYSRAQGGTENVKAYEQFMRARYVWRSGGDPTEVVPFLREAVRLDPDYNRAWLTLYLSLRTAISVFPDDAVAGWRQEREEAASHLEKMPQESMLALRYRAMRMVEQHKWAEAVSAAEAAVAAAPANDFDSNYALGLVLLCVGRLDASIPYLRHAVEAEPLHAETTLVLQGALRAAGREADANAENARAKSLGVKSNLPDKPPPWEAAVLRKTIAESPETTLNLAFFWGIGTPRSSESFKGFVRDVGLVDYWRTSSKWSDFCKPVGKDDFECH